jgi:hypothetical protein
MDLQVSQRGYMMCIADMSLGRGPDIHATASSKSARVNNAQRCQHGFMAPLACPLCEPGLYERARQQVERRLLACTQAGPGISSL